MAREALSGSGESVAEFVPLPSARGMLRIHVDDELSPPRQRLPDARLFPDPRGMTAAILA